MSRDWWPNDDAQIDDEVVRGRGRGKTRLTRKDGWREAKQVEQLKINRRKMVRRMRQAAAKRGISR